MHARRLRVDLSLIYRYIYLIFELQTNNNLHLKFVFLQTPHYINRAYFVITTFNYPNPREIHPTAIKL